MAVVRKGGDVIRKPISAITIGTVLLLFGLAGPLFARGPRWRRVDVGLATIPMQAVYAYDSLHIWASSAFGDVLFSKDGGFSWNGFNLNSCCPPLQGGKANSFFFFDISNGWIAGSAYNFPPPTESFRLRTTDEGNSWVTQLDTGHQVSSQILFLNQRRGFDIVGDACSFKDSILLTNDSGKTWQITTTGIPSCSIQRYSFVDSLNGWGVFRYSSPAPGDTFGLMRTRDGGKSWTALSFPSAYCMGARIVFLDTLNGWIEHCEPNNPGNQLRISRTFNGGQSWDSLHTFGPDYFFYTLKVLDTTNLWVAGRYSLDASVQFSSDGGRTWTEQMPGVGDDIVGFDAVDSNHAYAVGNSGYVYVYSPTLIGDLNLDWTLSASDVVLILNYTFLGIPTLVPPEDMDFNVDCLATAGDVVLLLNRIFLGHPQLQWGCAGS